MTSRSCGSMVAMAAVVAGSLLAPPLVAGQAAAPAEKRWDPPRTPDGQPDMQGYWGQRSDITTYSIQAGAIDREEHTRIGGQAHAEGQADYRSAGREDSLSAVGGGKGPVSPRPTPQTVKARVLRPGLALLPGRRAPHQLSGEHADSPVPEVHRHHARVRASLPCHLSRRAAAGRQHASSCGWATRGGDGKAIRSSST